MREGFEETFDPLIKSQDKAKASIDKQQTALINQLQDNQRAIASGLDKIYENNKRVLELNESAGINLETSQDSGEANFSGSELAIINKYGIPPPKDWRKNTKDTLKEVLEITNDEIKSLTGKINGKKKENKTQQQMIEEK